MSELKEKVVEGFYRDIATIRNAIGFEMFKDRRPVETTEEGISSVWLEDDEIELVNYTAQRVLKELIINGWSKAGVREPCRCGSNCVCGVPFDSEEDSSKAN